MYKSTNEGSPNMKYNNCGNVGHDSIYNFTFASQLGPYITRKHRLNKNSLEEVGQVHDVEEEVCPSDTGNPTEEEPAGELGPSVRGLQLVGLLLPAG